MYCPNCHKPLTIEQNSPEELPIFLCSRCGIITNPLNITDMVNLLMKEKESVKSTDDLSYIKQKIDEIVKTPTEDVRSDIIAAIKEQEQESRESQKTIRHYLILSYATKIGLGFIGWLKLQVIMPVIQHVLEFVLQFF